MRHGFLLVNKPVSPTSHDIVQDVRKTLHEKHVGHLGTLDPSASGLLVCAVGRKALKCVELFQNLTKEYDAHVTLGAASSTYDREGVIGKTEPKPGWEIPDQKTIERLIADRFVGKIEQVPPEASAIKVGGTRAYRKFRAGRGVNIPPRDIEIEECTVRSYAYPDLHLHVRCGSGTYIRSLAHDLGGALRWGGYLSGLERTMVGMWRIEDAVKPEHVAWAHVVPLKEILKDFPKVELSGEEVEHISHGRDIPYPSNREAPLSEGGGRGRGDIIAWFNGLPVAILVPSEDGTQCAHARKVL